MASQAKDIKALLKKIGFVAESQNDWTDISSIECKIGILNILMDTSLQCLGAIRLICVEIDSTKHVSDTTSGDDNAGPTERSEDPVHDIKSMTESITSNEESEEILTMNAMISTFEFAVHSMINAIASLDSLDDDQERYRDRKDNPRKSVFIDPHHNFEEFLLSHHGARSNCNPFQRTETSSKTDVTNGLRISNFSYPRKGLSVFE